MPGKLLDFEECESAFGLLGRMWYGADELWSLAKAKLRGVDLSRA